ncbi:MAG: metallophosphoesterase family protein [Patescibacteria group bacterium]|jgi:predicted phosphodiesterase
MPVIGVIADTHKDKNGATPHIISEFKRRGVEVVFHAGDLTEPEHFNSRLYGDFPVYYALVENQCERDDKGSCLSPRGKFFPPVGHWRYTMPGHRIIKRNGELYYLGHKLPFDFYLNMNEAKFDERLQRLRLENDGLRWIFGGHTHAQTYRQGHLVSMVNPGAAEESVNWGYEFAVVYTEDNQVVFGRVMPCPPQEEPFTVGIISDSLNVSKLDVGFWDRLRQEFAARGVNYVIHIGNIDLSDIGRPELAGFDVYYNLLPEQIEDLNIADTWGDIPANWHRIDPETPIVSIKGQRFYVKLDLALEFMDLSEMGMDVLAMKIRQKFPMTNYVLCGFTNEALYYEGQQIRIINPGDVNHDRNFATVCLPRHEITFGHVPVDPLPPLAF